MEMIDISIEGSTTTSYPTPSEVPATYINVDEIFSEEDSFHEQIPTELAFYLTSIYTWREMLPCDDCNLNETVAFSDKLKRSLTLRKFLDEDTLAPMTTDTRHVHRIVSYNE